VEHHHGSSFEFTKDGILDVSDDVSSLYGLSNCDQRMYFAIDHNSGGPLDENNFRVIPPGGGVRCMGSCETFD
jgi:hypothetical protein